MTDTVTPEAAAGDDPTPPRQVDAPLASPTSKTGLLEVFRRRYLLRLLVRREISARYQQSYLGLAWSYINPGIRFLMFYVVIGLIIGLDRGVDNFGLHMFAGMVLVHFFTETFNAGTRSLVSNKSLVRKMSLPREMFPVASMMVSLYHTVPGLFILLGACGVLGWSPDWEGFAAMLLAFAIVILLGTGMAVLFSVLNVFFQDFGKLVMTLTQFINFSVPMLYPYTFIPRRFGDGIFAEIYMWNPMVEPVLLMQRFFWAPTTENPAQTYKTEFPDDLWSRGFIVLGFCVVFLAFSQWLFLRLEDRIPERI